MQGRGEVQTNNNEYRGIRLGIEDESISSNTPQTRPFIWHVGLFPYFEELIFSSNSSRSLYISTPTSS